MYTLHFIRKNRGNSDDNFNKKEKKRKRFIPPTVDQEWDIKHTEVTFSYRPCL